MSIAQIIQLTLHFRPLVFIKLITEPCPYINYIIIIEGQP